MPKTKLDPKRQKVTRRSTLNLMQARFVQEYLVDGKGDGKAAAIRSGYSPKCADVTASKLLRMAKIQAALKAAQAKTAAKLEITREYLIKALLPIVDSDVQDYQDIDEGGFLKLKQFKHMPKGSTLAIESITEDRIIKETPNGDDVLVKDQRRVKLYDKIRAVETVAKMLGFMSDFKGSMDLNIKAVLSIADLKKSIAGYKKQ
jgi:phage terminase small subunit